MFLERMKTTDFDPKKKYTFVIPLGSTEQHGPFLPMGTDSYLQDAIIEPVEKRLPAAIFLPTLRISCSREHAGFPGSIWILDETMQLVLRDICQSLRPYAKNIAFVSWHGGNIVMLNRFIKNHEKTFQGVRLVHLEFDSEETTKKTTALLHGPVDEHAGNSEISMMLTCKKPLVSKPPKHYPKHYIESAWDAARLSDVAKDGIVDNHPEWVIDAKIGKKCIQMSADELKVALQKILKGK